MKFLELVIATCEECGVPTEGLTTVEGTITNVQHRRIIRWVAREWFRIQAAKATWKFMRETASFVTIDGQQAYTPVQAGITAGAFRTWKVHTFKNYITATGRSSEIEMAFLPYEDFRNIWEFGANRTVQTRPVHVSVEPNNSLLIGPAPNGAIYTITGDYYKAPVLMALNADVAAVPDGHDPFIIVHRARMRYGVYYGAKEQYAEGDNLSRGMMRKLLNDQLDDEVSFSGSLA